MGTLTADRYALTSSDELFFALDGRTVEADGDSWRIEVCGVHSTASRHWLQLQLCGPVAQGLTLRVERQDVPRVLGIVRDWLEGSLPAALESAVTGKAYQPVVTN